MIKISINDFVQINISECRKGNQDKKFLKEKDIKTNFIDSGTKNINEAEYEKVYKNLESKITDSVKDRSDVFQEDLFRIFEDTIDRNEEEKMKKLLTKEEYNVRIGVMMTQVLERIMETPPEDLLNYNDLDDDIYESMPPVPGDPRFKFDQERINHAIGKKGHV